jgi:hypothetical protein
VPWAKRERKLRWRSQNTGCLKSIAAQPKKTREEEQIRSLEVLLFISIYFRERAQISASINQQFPKILWMTHIQIIFMKFVQLIRKNIRVVY